MKKFFRSKPVQGIMALITLLIFWGLAETAFDYTRNYNGYCESEKRYLTDEEKIERALTRLEYIRHGVNVGDKKYPFVKYSSVQELLKKNPQCCRLEKMKYANGNSPGHHPMFMSRLWGTYAGHLRGEYDVQYLDESGAIKYIKRDVFKIVDNCGGVW